MTNSDVSAIVDLAIESERRGVAVERLWDRWVFEEPDDELIALVEDMCAMLAGMRREVHECAAKHDFPQAEADAVFDRIVADVLWSKRSAH